MTSYDEIAEWYDESIRAGTLLHELVFPGLFALTDDVGGQHVCDLACGQGVVARQLARRGARVVGIDVSTKLLHIARRDEAAAPLGIVYVHDDAQILTTVADETFDGVVCNMALMDIPDGRGVFRTVHRILRPAGWFVFSITHPCFETPTSDWADEQGRPVRRVVSGYFQEGFWRSEHPQGVRGRVGAYHRTLSTYVNLLTEMGLVVERFVEPAATGELAGWLPGFREVPAVLLVRCCKA